jgi:hypothetical protein
MTNGAREKDLKRGRRPKFAEPRRPITVTLPERTLRRLEAVDPDRAQAIVRLAEHQCASRTDNPGEMEVIEISPGCGIILVGPLRTLARIDLLRLVPVAPGRCLLTIPSGAPVESLEMEILDVIEDLRPDEAAERPVLEELRRLLTQQRRKKTILKREFLLIGT